MAIPAQLAVIQQAPEPARLRRSVDTIRLGLVLEEVHIAANARVLTVHLLSLLGLLVADHFAGVLAHKVAFLKVARREHAAPFILDHFDFKTVLAHRFDARLDVLALLLLQVRLALAAALSDLKVVRDLLVAVLVVQAQARVQAHIEAVVELGVDGEPRRGVLGLEALLGDVE